MAEESAAPSGEVSSDDKLWAALAYVFTPLIPIFVMLMDDKKDRPFIKTHSIQALAWAVVFIVLASVLTTVTLGFGAFCVVPLGILVQLYWAYKAYQGEQIEIPVISNFVRNQGWV